MKTIDALMEHMKSFAQTAFTDSGSIMPMWTLISENGQIIPVVSPFGDDSEKQLTVVVIRRMIVEFNVVMIGFMAETWIVDSKDDPTITNETMHDITPSQHPQRREGIMLVVENIYGKSAFGSFEINRDQDEKATLGEFTLMPGESHGGTFSGLFGKPETVN